MNDARLLNVVVCIAAGLSVTETLEACRVNERGSRSLCGEGLREALSQGIEREDIDGSWFGRGQ